MKQFIIFLLFSCSSLSFCQNSEKPSILYDENWNLIDEVFFNKKIQDRRYGYRLVETDSSIIGKIYLRYGVGQITNSLRMDLINHLNELTGVQIDSTQNIVINYYLKPESRPNGSCIDHYTSQRKYLKYFKKSIKDVQFFITAKDYKYRKKHVYEDKEGYIGNLLFEFAHSCGNYIIIRNDGQFFKKLGEYRQEAIPNQINSDWREYLN